MLFGCTSRRKHTSAESVPSLVRKALDERPPDRGVIVRSVGLKAAQHRDSLVPAQNTTEAGLGSLQAASEAHGSAPQSTLDLCKPLRQLDRLVGLA
jgi:hypothetical protein